MERILLVQAETGENIWQFNQYIFGKQDGNIFTQIRTGVGAMVLQRKFATPGDFISALLPILLTFGGLIFFVMLIIGSFQILMGGANPKSVEGGKKRITYALVGLLLLFATFWIGEIISAIFGLDIGLSTTTP